MSRTKIKLRSAVVKTYCNVDQTANVIFTRFGLHASLSLFPAILELIKARFTYARHQVHGRDVPENGDLPPWPKGGAGWQALLSLTHQISRRQLLVLVYFMLVLHVCFTVSIVLSITQ